MWLLFAIIAALLALFGGGGKQEPAKTAAVAAVCGASLDGGTLSGTGLTPGAGYAASFEFVPDDGGVGFNLGYSAQTVKADGSVVFPNELEDVDPRGVPGSLRAWMHVGQPFDAPAALCPDGSPLEASSHLS